MTVWTDSCPSWSPGAQLRKREARFITAMTAVVSSWWRGSWLLGRLRRPQAPTAVSRSCGRTTTGSGRCGPPTRT